jgi:hypothetical protein
MSPRTLDDLGRAANCVALLMTLGANLKSVFVSDHGVTITLTEPGTLPDHLDAKQVPVTLTAGAYMALVHSCLVSWPRKAAP